MPKYEVMAECVRYQIFYCESESDAKDEMYEYLQDIGMDAGRFSLSAEEIRDEQ